MRRVTGRAARALAGVLAVGAVATFAWGIVAGYRPVVVTTGSMAPSAPAGSLIVARPKAPAAIAVGDVVMMHLPGGSRVSHRVIERNDTDGVVTVRTQGDANPSPDPMPYTVAGDHLVARWIVPHAGRALAVLGAHSLAWAAAATLTGVGLILMTSHRAARRDDEARDEDSRDVATGRDRALPATTVVPALEAIFTSGRGDIVFCDVTSLAANAAPPPGDGPTPRPPRWPSSTAR